MAKYQRPPKTDIDHSYEDARDAARSEVRRIARRLTDTLYIAIDDEFRRSLQNGEQIVIHMDSASIRKSALSILKKQLKR